MGLSFREKLQESVKKGGLSNDELHHPSRAYERHFEGYLETSEPIPGKKRSRSVRTYVDSIWVRELTAKQSAWRHVLLAVLWAAALPPFLYSATRLVPANTVWYVTLPQAAALFFLAWTALCLYRCCTAPREMTVRQHRLGVSHLQISSCIAWITLAVGALVYLIYALSHSADRTVTLICAALSALSCVFALALFLVQRTIRYTEKANPLAG